MDRLRPLDASFLHAEDEVHHGHLGTVAVFEGPAPDEGELAGAVVGKLPLVPRYRQRLRTVPLHLGRPVWAADPHFQLDYHVRRTALPAPGGPAQLRALLGRVMSQKLDRDKPLWELWAVEGLEDGRWALVSKTHHAMIDGVTGTDLLTLLLDRDREPTPPVSDTWHPGHDPSRLRLFGDSLLDYIASPFEQWRAARALLVRPARAARSVVGELQGRTRPPGTPLTGRVGPHRTYAWAQGSLDDVAAIRSSLGGTVHDVVLAAVAAGLRTWLKARGARTAGVRLRALTPVSVRHRTEYGTYNNRVASQVVSLHLGADPVQRLRSLEVVTAPKQHDEPIPAGVLVTLSGFAPPLLLALGTRSALRATNRLRPVTTDTVITNVPGPADPLYAMGRRMLVAYPYAPLAADARIAVAVYSYAGTISFGFTSDRDAVPDVEVVARGTEAGLAELVEASQPRPRALRQQG